MAGEAEVTTGNDTEQNGGAEKTGAAETILNTGADGAAAEAGKQAGLDKGKADAGISDRDKADWPSDWRDKMAGGDEKFRKQLDRYGSPLDVAKKGRELEAKLSSGEYKRDLPKGANEQQIAEWRKERGIPENEAGYIDSLKLPDGVVLGEADKPIVEGFAAAALKGHVAPEQFNGLVAQYYAMQDKVAAERAEQDLSFREETKVDLVQEWGAEYRPNVTAVNNYLKTWPEELASGLLSARDANGRMMGDNPAFIRQMAAMVREIHPEMFATLVPGANGETGKSIDGELAEIRKLRQGDPDKYDSDKELQARELKLLDIQSKRRGKAAA